jgi:hypothetical protein
MDISGWVFTDSKAGHEFTFPHGTIVEPDGYLVLVENDSAFTARFPNVKNFIGEMGFALNGAGENVKLVNEEGQIVDSLTYDDQVPWPVDADGSGATLELLDPTRDNALGENWKASVGRGSPGRKNSVMTAVGEKKNEIIPDTYGLSQNYPNPFNPRTNIEFQIPDHRFVTLAVFDMLGRQVRMLVSEYRNAGIHVINFDADNLPSGVYFYKLTAGSYAETRKLLFIK